MGGKTSLVVNSAASPAVEEIVAFLRQHGYLVRKPGGFAHALAEIPTACPQVVLLLLEDTPFPPEVWEVCRLAKRIAQAIVFAITFTDRVEDRVAALRGGMDDCLAWPVDLEEMLARIEALSRRKTWVRARQWSHGDLWVDFETREVWVKGERKDLTPREFDLLAALIRHARHRALDDRSLLGMVWPESGGSRGLLRQYIRRLRQKIEPDPASPRYILHEPGFGYRLAPAEGSEAKHSCKPH